MTKAKKFHNRKTLENAAHAINHPVRFEIIEMLRQSEEGLAVHEIIDRCRNAKNLFKNSVEQPIISSHLKTLLKAGFVEKTPQGKERIYHLDMANVQFFDFLTDIWVNRDMPICEMTPLSIPSRSTFFD